MSVCIACLSGKVQIHNKINTELLQLYEKLADTKLYKEDASCQKMCSKCCEQLQRCQNFSLMARRSARILCDLVKKGLEVTNENINALNLNMKQGTPLDEQYHTPISNNEVYIKQEPTDNETVPVEFELINADKNRGHTIKSEYKTEPDGDEDMETEDTHTNYSKQKVDDDKTQEVLKADSIKQKIHACNDCAKTFPDRKQLQEHLKIHAGKKPFVCRICSKIFPHQDNLSKHFKTHPREKPYACEFCVKTFQRVIDLKQHIVLLHNEKAPVHSAIKGRLKRK